MTTTRAIIVGYGGLTRGMLRHLNGIDWYETGAIVDVREEALADAQQAHDLPDDALFTSMRDALASGRGDVVLINTPSELHYAQVKAALEAGLHVLVAKPITNNFEEAVELVELAAARGATLAVGQQMRYNRHYTAVREFVAAAELGQVETMNFLSAKPRHKALNLVGMAQPTLYEMSCHHFDSILSIFPNHVPERITCDGFRPSWSVYDGPCSINALLNFSNGLHILYHGGFSSQSDLYEVRLEGTAGALRCRGIHMSNDTMHYDVAARGGTFAERAIDAAIPSQSPWPIFFDHWQHYMHHGSLADGTEPPFSGRNNLKVFAMLSAGIDSITSGQPVAIAGNPRYANAFT